MLAQNPLQDKELSNYHNFFHKRINLVNNELKRIRKDFSSLKNYADLHLHLGMHKINNGKDWCLREYMPKVTGVWLTTSRNAFLRRDNFKFKKISLDGWWELIVPCSELLHGTYIELCIGTADSFETQRRIPAFSKWVEQDKFVKEQWCARVYDPDTVYEFKHDDKRVAYEFPMIYEAHVGIAQNYNDRTADSVGTFKHFTEEVLPRIKKSGYNAVQLMGILEHLLYISFGYQISNYFAVSSRFGTAEDFKELVDKAHELGIMVILDIAHSHSPSNVEQGISKYDTSDYFFNENENQWGTRSFNFDLDMTRRFLLSNCRYWLEEFHVDGFRFDAVGNIVYKDHGKNDDFNEVNACFYDKYGNERLDENGVLYLSIANTLIHEMKADAITIAEEFSGIPGLTSKIEDAGLGFDYRFAMGIPDFWAKFIEDSNQTMGKMWYEMTNHRPYDRTINYMECHDQCINGDDAMIWRLIGNDMYTYMSVFSDKWSVSRGLAMFKLMRLLTLCTADKGYLNFMGNEFGHPEWIDGEEYGHRQWHLSSVEHLKYAGLGRFDDALVNGLVHKYPEAFLQQPEFRAIHEDDRYLAFSRGNLLFVVNMHDMKAQTSLNLNVPAGKYTEILSSDEEIFAGHGNLTANNREHFTKHNADNSNILELYLPPLCAVVLERS